jgi:hypothetical protein
MKASLLAALNESERLLVAETETAALAALDEDDVAALHDRVRRARNKYVGQYRRGASARVPAAGGRGKARPANQLAAIKAEAFEEALSRVSRRLAVLARRSAVELRDERLASARGSARPAAKKAATTRAAAKKTVTPPRKTPVRRGVAARTPASEKARASTRAAGDRRQGKRDSR